MIRRGIVVVHGVGESGKGAYLDLFVEPLARFIGDAIGDRNVIVEARNESDVGTMSTATLLLRDPGTQTVIEEWRIHEAWWARTFQPSNAQSVLYWGIIGGLAALWVTFRNVFLRNALRFLAPARYERMRLARTDLRGRPLDPASGGRLGEQHEGIWAVAGASRPKSLIDAFIWLLITVGYLVIALAGLLIVVPVYLLLLTPLALVIPQVSAVQRAIVGALVRGVGDQQATTTRRFALAAASNEVSRALAPMLEPAALAEARERDPGFRGYRTVTVVAYSGGTVVAFDALATRAAEWMSRPVPIGIDRPARVNWITAGSGLNLAYRMRRRRNAHDTAFWSRRIDHYVNWLNIYARYDPVPQGPPPGELVELLVGEDGWLALAPDTSRARPPYVCVRVVNDDFPATDHFGYWRNGNEVLARVAHVVLSDELGNTAIDPQRVAFAPSSLSSLASAVEQRTARARDYRTGVLRRQLPVYLAMLAFLALLPWAAEPGRWVLGTDGFFGQPPLSFRGYVLDDLLPRAISGISIEGYRDWLVGGAAVAFVALLAVQLIQLLVTLVQWVRDGGSFWFVVAPVGATAVAVALLMWALAAAA